MSAAEIAGAYGLRGVIREDARRSLVARTWADVLTDAPKHLVNFASCRGALERPLEIFRLLSRCRRVYDSGRGLRRGCRPVRGDDLPPLRGERSETACDQPRPLAELRSRASDRDVPRDSPPRVRFWDHPLRPGEQLWAALRLGGAGVRRGASS